MVKVIWDLNNPLPKRRVNNQVVVKPITRDQLREVGKILVVTWGGFIKDPETTVKYVGPYMDNGLEQPFIAYLKGKPVGCVSPRLNRETKSGVLDGGVHVLHAYRRQKIGTTLLLIALKWLRDNGMESAWVTPNNPESPEATQRAETFYLATEGTRDNIESFKKDLLQNLGSNNIILIYHHGSRVRGEARSESDYDTILVLKEINENTLLKIREVLSKHEQFQTYLLSQKDLKDLPPGQRLQFFEGKKLYGDLNLEPPSREEVLEEIRRCRLENLHYFRHYLTLPHDKERKARVVFHKLKEAYFYMRKIAYYTKGDLVSTRTELMKKLSDLPVNQDLARELLQTLESYTENKQKITENPDRYLFRLEKFFRTSRVLAS